MFKKVIEITKLGENAIAKIVSVSLIVLLAANRATTITDDLYKLFDMDALFESARAWLRISTKGVYFLSIPCLAVLAVMCIFGVFSEKTFWSHEHISEICDKVYGAINEKRKYPEIILMLSFEVALICTLFLSLKDANIAKEAFNLCITSNSIASSEIHEVILFLLTVLFVVGKDQKPTNYEKTAS